MSGKSLQKPPYGNCQILAPDGTLMCRCNRSRTDWYTARGLASVVSEDPYTIQLNFQPKGLGKAGDPFYMQALANRCVVCGTTDDLTKHHCVPICYRQHFPAKKKESQCHDVLAVCLQCHHNYEPYAFSLKQEIQKEYGIGESTNLIDHALIRAQSYAHALKEYSDKIPEGRQKVLRQTICDYLKKESINDSDIAALLEVRQNKATETPSQKVVQKLIDIDAFIKRWRQHFLDTMKPSYMPKFWNVDHREKNSFLTHE